MCRTTLDSQTAVATGSLSACDEHLFVLGTLRASPYCSAASQMQDVIGNIGLSVRHYKINIYELGENEMSIIRHKIKEIRDVVPWGNEVDGYSLHWFGITDYYYWISLGQTELLRYTDEFLDKYGLDREFPYVDYQFARIFEDFFAIFSNIVTPVPEYVFKYIEDIDCFDAYGESLIHWLNNVWDEEDQQFDEVFSPARDWICDRKLDFGYLIGAPDIYFFTYNDNVYIRWECKYTDDEGTKMWKESRGEFIISYSEFLEGVKQSFDSFFDSMDERVNEILNEKAIYNFSINKELLVKNHNERKRVYNSSFKYIVSELDKEQANWNKIKESIKLILGR